MEKIYQQDQQGPQKLGFLKSLNIQNTPPIPGIFTPATIRLIYLSQFNVAKP